jgi:hypothetical protein
VAEVLSAIYEVDFLGFSYGFRPGRSPHQALEALHTAFMTQYVNWVLDAVLSHGGGRKPAKYLKTAQGAGALENPPQSSIRTKEIAEYFMLPIVLEKTVMETLRTGLKPPKSIGREVNPC